MTWKMASKTTREILDRKGKHLIPCVYHFYRNPPVLARGEGPYLFDRDGKKYLDLFSGVSVNHLGHCHPAVTRAIREQAATLCHTTTLYLTEPMLDLAEKMVAIAPVDEGKVFFCASGSEANETAAFLARRRTGHNGFAALENSLHGSTALTLSLTGIAFWKTDLSPVGGVVHAPAAYCYRCPFGKAENTCGLECAGELERVIANAREPVAALFIEIIQANGGIVVPPVKWFNRLKEIIAEQGILLIVDEVQTALGRTGRMFACEHFDLKPDIIAVAKAFGGGLPLGAAIASDDVAAGFSAPRASTFGGNLVAARAGCAVIDTVRGENLIQQAQVKGNLMASGLGELKRRYPVIGDVRGLGLMMGAELVGENRAADPRLTDDILESMKDKGFILGKAGQGRNVLVFMPPLIVAPADIGRALDALDGILQKKAR
jgi:4-aminobutyrate aminotransferase-like enzyme